MTNCAHARYGLRVDHAAEGVGGEDLDQLLENALGADHAGAISFGEGVVAPLVEVADNEVGARLREPSGKPSADRSAALDRHG